MPGPDNAKPEQPSRGENYAHPLYELLGAPLLALVQAESQAAQATADFIQQVGFSQRIDTTAQTSTDNGQASEFDSLGKMRMATFSNEMQGPDGNLQTVNIQVPLLSLVPVPALQIKDAELEFYVRIVDFSKAQTNAKLRSAVKADSENTSAPAGEESDFLSSKRMQFRASMGRSPGNGQHPSAMDAQIKIKIKMAQADIPVGLAKLFNIMDQSVSITQAKPEQS